MDKKTLLALLAVAVLVSSFFFINLSLVNADLQSTPQAATLNFLGNDVDSNGVLWAGDKNFSLYKSTDKGATFQFVYNLPHELPKFPDNPYSGMVWTVFVDSRNYIFVSGGGDNNSLYRSTNGGASFTAVLNANDTSNRSFYISMTEDNQSSLYAATYTIGSALPQLLKSTDGGTSWSRIGNFSVIHFHNIKFNPYNGYLYAITGERSGNLANCNDSEKIFRSKDYGATWSLLVDRNDTLGTVYLPMAFIGNTVYVGQDFPNRSTCQIHRFLDDGRNGTITPQVVYTPPADGSMPYMSGVLLGNTLVFGNTAEVQNGTARTIFSVDGSNWSVLTSQSVLGSDNRWNSFTAHPRTGVIFSTMKSGYSYQIADVPPTPAPTASLTPSPIPTDSPTENPIPIASPTEPPVVAPNPTPQPTSKTIVNKPTPTSTPKPIIHPAPTPNLTSTPTATPFATAKTSGNANNGSYYELVLITAVMVSGAAISITLIKKQANKRIK